MKTKELNLCEILKDCPKGTELYCPFLGKVYFEKIDHNLGLIVRDRFGEKRGFFSNGKYVNCADAEISLFPSKDNRDWSTWKSPEPKIERFDPKALKTYDNVLVRDYFDTVWIASFFSSQRTKTEFGCVNGTWKYCIPYNDDTKHLVGTTDDAPEYYRYWED